MRSRLVMLFLGLVSTLGAGLAQSASPVAPVPSPATTIATLNFNAAVLGTAEAQKTLGALQKKFLPREQELQKLNDAVEASKKQLSEGGAKLTEAERNQKIQELGAKDKQLQREAEDYKNDSQAESQEAFQQVAQKVFLFVQEYSAQHGYSMVLERGTDAAPIVWYAASNVDITDRIIKGYDAKSRSGLPDSPEAARPLPSSSKKP